MLQTRKLTRRINDWPLTVKLVAFALVIALIPTLIIGFLGLSSATHTLRQAAFTADGIRTREAALQTENFFANLKADVVLLATSPVMYRLLDVIQNRPTDEVMNLIKLNASSELMRAREQVAQEMIALMWWLHS